eukprot:evm.model.scf_2719.1 EVM.evm.TU.scf_2719.1   scf_2719:886-3085(-)
MQPPKKKRANDGELTRDNFESQDANDLDGDPGTFAKASSEDMRRRRVVRVRRSNRPEEAPAAPAEDRRNPFAGISLTGGTAMGDAQRGDSPWDQAGGGGGSAMVQPPAGAGCPEVGNGVNGSGKPGGAAEHGSPGGDNGGSTPMPGAAKTGIDPKRKREGGPVADGTSDTAPAVENGTDAHAQPASKKGKVEISTGGTPAFTSPTSSASEGATSFAAFASSTSPFQGVASGTAFGNTSIFTAPPLATGSVTVPAFSFGTSLGSSHMTSPKGDASKGTAMFSTGATRDGDAHPTTDSSAVPAAMHIKPLFSSSQGPSAESKLPGQVKVVTGEEDENTVFAAKGILYQIEGQTWKETCRGELRLNARRDDQGPARLVMRQKATLRVCLNASLYPQMPVSLMERSGGVVFHCVNWADAPDRDGSAEGSQGPLAEQRDGGRGGSASAYAVRFVDKADGGASLAEGFVRLVNMHKGEVASAASGKPAAKNE